METEFNLKSDSEKSEDLLIIAGNKTGIGID